MESWKRWPIVRFLIAARREVPGELSCLLNGAAKEAIETPANPFHCSCSNRSLVHTLEAALVGSAAALGLRR
jgi:hypothetical protein